MAIESKPEFVEEVELHGHIIDSLLLPKVLDEILTHGGSYVIKDIHIGRRTNDPSHARLEVRADSDEVLETILNAIHDHGAVATHVSDCQTVPADIDGAFPEGFYSTTNFRTQVRLGGRMDRCRGSGDGLRHPRRSGRQSARVRADDRRANRRSHRRRPAGAARLPGRSRDRSTDLFEFMASPVSSEKPKGVSVREIAAAMRRTKEAGEKILAVLGPAVVHTGGVETGLPPDPRRLPQRPLRRQRPGRRTTSSRRFTAPASAFRSTRACPPTRGTSIICAPINTIRRLGGIRQAVDAGVLKSGIMYECVKHTIPFVLAGSIRDDGPLPEVITDVLVAQSEMRKHVPGVGFCLMVATMLHSIAVGNLLPAWVKVACVDINPATVTKLMDRGSTQTVGIVTDAEPFLRALAAELLG